MDCESHSPQVKRGSAMGVGGGRGQWCSGVDGEGEAGGDCHTALVLDGGVGCGGAEACNWLLSAVSRSFSASRKPLVSEGRSPAVTSARSRFASSSSKGWALMFPGLEEVVKACLAGEGKTVAVGTGTGEVTQFRLLHRPLRIGKQVEHALPDFLQAHLVQRPLPLHRQHTVAGMLHR